MKKYYNDIKNKINLKYILFAGLLVAVYFIVKNTIKNLPNLLTSTTDSKAQTNNLDSFAKQQSKVQKQTKTDSEWKIIADTIYQDLRYSSLSDNKAHAGVQICRVKNDTDVAVLIKQFGVRSEIYVGIFSNGDDKTLPEFVIQNFTMAEISKINDNYKRKGIKFQY